MGSLDRWTGECVFVKGFSCPYQPKMYTSNWSCMRDCDKIESLREKTDTGITVRYGKVQIIGDE